MRYLHYKVKAGPEDLIAVNMNERTDHKLARVLLLDTGNYFKYRLGKVHEAKQIQEGAPVVVLEPPYRGDWHVIVEMTVSGEVRAYIEVQRKGR
mgnify:CR=1 FL=1